MDRYSETFETWNKIAHKYEDKFMDLALYNDTYDFFCNLFHKPNSKILEIGCGPGNITKYILSKRSDFEILGIDIAPNMIELAQKNNPTASFKIMDIRQIDELTANYDGIVGGFCLPYISLIESIKLIIDCYSLLNENGIIYLSFVEGNPNNSGFQVGSSGDRIFFNFYNLEELIKQLHDSKFEILKIFKVAYKITETTNDIHTIIIAQKLR